MLYALHEMQHALWMPWAALAQVNRSLFSDPLSPLAYTPLSKSVAASAELMLRVTQRYTKPLFDIDSVEIDGEPVAVTEEIALAKPFCELRH